MPLTRETMAAFSREMQKIAILGDVSEMVGHQGQLAMNLLNPQTTGSTLRSIYQSSSNLDPQAVAELAKETATANQELQAAGKAGRYVSDISRNGGGLLNRARAGGWLSNIAKYEGPSTFRQIRNSVARALPGQRSLLAASVLPTAYSAAKKTDETGRVRGVGERTLGTAGALAGTLATQAPSVMRMMGTKGLVAGTVGGMIGSHFLGRGLSRAGQWAGQRFDSLGKAPAPQAQLPMQQPPAPTPSPTV